MKKLLLLFTVCIPWLACHENKISASDVPSAVSSAFNTRYPNASNVEWEQEKVNSQSVFEAEFKNNGKKVEAEFDSISMLPATKDATAAPTPKAAITQL